MRKSIWYNNNIHYFVVNKPANKKNKISFNSHNSLFYINKYFISSNENNSISLNLYKKLEFSNLYFIYYIFFLKNMQSRHLLNKNVIHFLFNKAFQMFFIRFI